MNTKPLEPDSTARRRPTQDPARRAALNDMATRPTGATAPCILDAVCDQHGGRWIRFGTRQRAIWFAIADLIREGPAVFGRLSSVGASCLTTTSQGALKRTIEMHGNYREALVATRPGWLEGFYVFGDGTMASPRADDREVIVTFEINAKFIPRGTLAEWQEAVAPFVAEQPLSYFALALSLCGPVLRVAPRGYVNPQVETVGKGEIGKSGLGVLGASVWAGNPDNDCGGGEIWDLTLNSFANRRCLVPVDGFYEWRKVGKAKQPYAIGMADRQPFTLAGLWESWKDRDSGEWVRTFTIMTTEANELVNRLHDRMPVVIAPEERERWLSDPDPSDLLRPYPAEPMTMWPVSQLVNSPKNDSPDLRDPIEDPFPWSEASGVEGANSPEATGEPTNSE